LDFNLYILLKFMKVKVKKSEVSGKFFIPTSKSHTIRAIFFATLASGESKIYFPLISADTNSAMEVCKGFGASISYNENKKFLTIKGTNGKPNLPENVLDVGNSGTTLRIGVSTASLIDGYTIFTGDHQIRNRPLEGLIYALNNLGAWVVSAKNNGKAPVIIKGKAKGGKTDLKAVTSQYLTSLLINAPLFENDTEIIVTILNEKPYVEMTLKWLDMLNIKYENENFKKFYIYGNQNYKNFEFTIPGDFSSASFILVLGALSKNKIILENMDMDDIQGDKRVVYILKDMGAEVNIFKNEKRIEISGGKLFGMKIDMNDIPDALPIMAVAGCFAEGETHLLNVPQARLKETDRIKVMHNELKKMGANIEELEDGLIIKKSNLKGCNVDSHFDHRVAMALTIAGLFADGETIINNAEAVNVTFPNFFDSLKKANALIEEI